MITARLRRPQLPLDAGFTLVEMVISILILGIIMVPLTTSYVLGLGTATSTAQAVSNSSDAELVAAYLTTDIASANTVSPGDMTAGQACSGGATTILQFATTDLSASGTPPTVYMTYVLAANSDAAGQLHLAAGTVDELDRITCNASGSPTGTLTLARTIQTSPLPVASCDRSACSNNSQPQQVSLSLTEFEYQKLNPPTPDAPFTFTVTATRRVNS